MSWWPDKDTQVAYLNYMTKALSNGEETKDVFTIENSQASLNAAAQILQRKIEVKIAANKSTDWLRQSIELLLKTKINGTLILNRQVRNTSKKVRFFL